MHAHEERQLDKSLLAWPVSSTWQLPHSTLHNLMHSWCLECASVLSVSLLACTNTHIDQNICVHKHSHTKQGHRCPGNSDVLYTRALSQTQAVQNTPDEILSKRLSCCPYTPHVRCVLGCVTCTLVYNLYNLWWVCAIVCVCGVGVGVMVAGCTSREEKKR